MELTVVVILDNPGPLAISPVEKGKPALDGERHAQRILMRRCNEREPRVGRAPNRRSHVESAIIDSDAHELKLGLLQQIAREDISGILDPNLDAGLEHGLMIRPRAPWKPAVVKI